jgi:hypothetical protein
MFLDAIDIQNGIDLDCSLVKDNTELLKSIRTILNLSDYNDNKTDELNLNDVKVLSVLLKQDKESFEFGNEGVVDLIDCIVRLKNELNDYVIGLRRLVMNTMVV